MFYLSKFCRICIQTGGSLLDINSTDYDSVTLSEKLQVCSKMVISRESLSTQICSLCVQKLRISYEFQEMCARSSKILRGYLAELISVSDKITPEQFKNSELRVTVTPLQSPSRPRKKRVSKEQRCSLLKKLLSSKEEEEEEEGKQSDGDDGEMVIKREPAEETDRALAKGGLRDLIRFTQGFDYGFELDPCEKYEMSPLDKLADFSERFFCKDLDFRNAILYVLNAKEAEDSEGDEMFERGSPACRFEEVIVEPDIKIKTEVEFVDESESFGFTSSGYAEACYSDDEAAPVKREGAHVSHNRFLAEIIPVGARGRPDAIARSTNNNLASKYETLYKALNAPVNHTSPATDLLGQFVAKFSQNHRRRLSPSSLRCRTRGNPYINPLLQKQFQLRNFKCDTCNRRFKSPGYLKAHQSKVRH